MSQIQRSAGIVKLSENVDIQDVPNEILDYIFEAYVKMGQSPWLLTLVSRVWRMTSLANPNLWRYIHITMGGFYHNSSYTRWWIEGDSLPAVNYRNRQVCSSVDGLTRALRRTGSTTLDVTIGTLTGWVEDLVGVLFSDPISSRIMCLEFSHRHRFNQVLRKDEMGPFSALEQIVISSRVNMGRVLPLIFSIQRTAFKLREFHLGSPIFGELLEQNPKLNPESMKALFGRLHYLTMTGNGAREVDAYVKYCSHLVGLTCDFPEWPDEFATVETLKNIQILSLNCAPKNLHRLHLSSLRELALDDSTNPWTPFSGPTPPISSERLDLPSLVTLRVASHSLDWLIHWHVPRLRELHLTIRQQCICHYSDRNQQLYHPTCIFKPSFWRGLPRHLSKLTLEASCTEENFIVVLDSLRDIQSLTFIPKYWQHKPKYHSQILQRLAEMFTNGFLSQIEVFIFGTEVWPTYQLKETLDFQVFHALDIRRQRDRGIIRFDVHWSDGTVREKLSYARW